MLYNAYAKLDVNPIPMHFILSPTAGKHHVLDHKKIYEHYVVCITKSYEVNLCFSMLILTREELMAFLNV